MKFDFCKVLESVATASLYTHTQLQSKYQRTENIFDTHIFKLDICRKSGKQAAAAAIAKAAATEEKKKINNKTKHKYTHTSKQTSMTTTMKNKKKITLLTQRTHSLCCTN